nr:MAG TPA: hypothetical protein [Caudoviricetes sp.]
MKKIYIVIENKKTGFWPQRVFTHFHLEKERQIVYS